MGDGGVRVDVNGEVKLFFFGGGGGRVGRGGGGQGQVGCEQRSKVFVKIQKKKNLRGGGEGGPIRNCGGGGGGSKVWGR